MEKPFQKPPKIAVEWRDEMYYGDTKTDGIIGTKNKAGTNYACEYATVSIVKKRPDICHSNNSCNGKNNHGHGF